MRQLCNTGLDHVTLLVKPLGECSQHIEECKLKTATTYKDLAAWALAVLRAMCPRWDEDKIVENEE